MTNEDQIKGHFSAMAECTGNLRRNFDPTRVVENDEVTQYLQKQLDAIRKLLEPEPETLAATVNRLTDICNTLGRENALLRNDLTEADVNLNAVTKSNVGLREKLASRDAYLQRVRDQLERIKAWS